MACDKRRRPAGPACCLTAALVCWCAWLSSAPAADEERDGPYIEKFDNDLKKIEAFYKKGRREGRYQEFWPSGRIKIRAGYRDDKLTGLYQEYNDEGKLILQYAYLDGLKDGACTDYFANGKVKCQAAYAQGLLHGVYRSYADDGRTLEKQAHYIYGRDDRFPRPAAEIQKELQTIAADTAKLDILPASAPATAPGVTGDAGAGGHAARGAAGTRAAPMLADAASLRQTITYLQQARAIAGVPYADLTFKQQYRVEAQAGTDLLTALGKIDHHPERPAGFDEERYRLGKNACEHGNLAHGFKSLLGAQNFWLFDSDEKNKESVGHRRWSLNQSMLQLAYGQTGNIYVMWAHDRQRAQVPEFTAIPWPAAGYHPVGFFGSNWCWHVSLNPKKFQAPVAKDIQVKMWAVDRSHTKQGQPLELEHFCVNNDGYGVRYAVIWRPKTVDIAPGKAYYLEIEGLKDNNGQPVAYNQLTEFIP